MLRTRRRDNNVKPNRRDSRLTRLDRKSSRGMIYENEELRLKTININAEIERGQSDIKKLKRENEMLKKEIWCLRDEYDKLDRLLKEKKIDFSSSTNGSSDSESCSSCSENSNEVETYQNLENVQKTNLENIHKEFDHLSVVPEESTENSEKNSNNTSMTNDEWNLEKNIIKPDQSYPIYQSSNKNLTLPIKEKISTNFFSPINLNRDINTYNHNQENNVIYPNEYYQNSFENISQQEGSEYPHDINEETVKKDRENHLYENMILVPKVLDKNLKELYILDKSSTDLMVKMDNHNFDNRQVIFNNYNTSSQSTFSSGGNFDELLNEIKTISQHKNGTKENHEIPPGQVSLSSLTLPHSDYLPQVDLRNMTPCQSSVMENLLTDAEHQMYLQDQKQNNEGNEEKPFKSELNVVLMPNPMPIIGFDKYKNIQRSFENLNSISFENCSTSQLDLTSSTNIIPTSQCDYDTGTSMNIINPNVQNSNRKVSAALEQENYETNPFFFSRLKDNYVNADYFNKHYNLENLIPNKKSEEIQPIVSSNTIVHASGNQMENSLDNPHQLSNRIHSENTENIKLQTTSKMENSNSSINISNSTIEKKPKLSIRRKVSIHFKGKKDRGKKVDNPTVSIESSKCSQTIDKKHSIFDIKHRVAHQKTPSIDSKKSVASIVESKTPPTCSSSKTNNSDKKNVHSPEKKEMITPCENKCLQNRKSTSISPDRSKHVHVKDEGSGKKHKKHRRSEKQRNRRGTVNSLDTRHLRERSFSVCTDKSNILLDSRLGYSSGCGMGSSYLYDDYSDRERTNSVSSCETINVNTNRKLSGISNIQLNDKVPWCGCWGNGCL